MRSLMRYRSPGTVDNALVAFAILIIYQVPVDWIYAGRGSKKSDNAVIFALQLQYEHRGFLLREMGKAKV